MKKMFCKSRHCSRYHMFLVVFVVCFFYFMSRREWFTASINKDVRLILNQVTEKAFTANNYVQPNAIVANIQITSELKKQYAVNNPNTLNQTFQQYLDSVTKWLHNETLFNDSFSEHILRNGIGLEPYITKKNKEIWIENGVHYRPFPFLEKDNPYYTADFEAYVPFNKSAFFHGDERRSSVDIKQKKIILWWQQRIAKAPIKGLNPLRACPDFPCVLTSDRNYTQNSSAMLVDAHFVNNEKPPTRRNDQVLIHYHTEPPANYWFYGDLYEKSRGWQDVFNWTMSFRRDSDITTYYGMVRRRRVVKEKNYTDILAKKSGIVAWVVSQCSVGSKRAEYVKQLQKYVPVDIYGECGKIQCPRKNDKTCVQQMEMKYKFYLAFENNICKDYITEKLYKYLDSDMIVVARGYNTYSRILPSEIFLNTANFKSPKELADKLLYLNSHDQEYIKILKEKDKYFSIYEDYPVTNKGIVYLAHRFESVPMCKLCQMLWNLERYSKTVENIAEWFNKPEYQCHVPRDI